MTKEERIDRWTRRKAKSNPRTPKHGTVGGNVRYSGKGGTGGWPDTRSHRCRKGKAA